MPILISNILTASHITMRRVRMVAGYLLLAASCVAQTFELRKKPPAAVVKSPTGQVLALIPIEARPAAFAYSRSANTLYVIHDANKGDRRSLSVINLGTKQVDRVIKVDYGIWPQLIMSADGSRLFCVTGAPGILKRGTKAPYAPKLAVIDTTSNELVTTYEWFDSLRRELPDGPFLGNQFFPAGDGRHVVALFSSYRRLFRLADQRMAVFSALAHEPVFHAHLKGNVISTMFSLDEQVFIAATESDDHRGQLNIINLSNGTEKVGELTDRPLRLTRLGRDQTIWAIGHTEMRSISEQGELRNQPIYLNKPRKIDPDIDASTPDLQDAYPGETISLGRVGPLF